ncbi:hypothetical protein [Streptomyces coeruleorubidus]|uniref:hypothetical protein n=1 Tax=Streptomyces coeruleorubidus TaxID=116188 RepID=UPI003F541431
MGRRGNRPPCKNLRPGVLDVQGLEAAEIGERAAAAGLVLHELFVQEASLEEAFMELTRDAVEYHATTAEFPTTGGTYR